MNEFEEYNKIPKTIDLVKANIFGIFIIVPIAAIYLVPFILIWRDKFTIDNLRHQLQTIDFMNNALSIMSEFFLVVIGGVFIHELIHGLTWSIFAKKGFKSIKFGVLWKMLTPYCHCDEPLTVAGYLIGAVMPAIILGFIPAIIALVTGNVMLMLFAFCFTIGAVGDFMIINLIRNESKRSLILDHPSEAGYYVLEKK
jgi:hypothetical protein